MNAVFKFMEFVADNANLPALVLVFLLLVLFAVAVRAQAMPDFSWANLFRDESGKESSARFIMLLATFTSTWMMVYFAITVVKTADDLPKFQWYMFGYMLITTFPKYAEKLIDGMIAKWSK